MRGIDREASLLTGHHGNVQIHGNHGHRWRAVLHGLICLAVLTLSAGVSGTSMWPRGPSAVTAQDTACTTSGPDSGTFTVRLCLTGPDDGETLTGNVTVSATLSVVSGAAPPNEYLQFYFTSESGESSSSVLRDYASPFTFTLPTERWTDRTYRLEVEAEFEDDPEEEYTTPKTGIVVTTANGVTRLPASTGRWDPHDVEGDDPVVLAAVGDGAGGLPGATDVANLIEGWDPDMLLYLGDVYNVGSYTEFLNYYDPTLGRMKGITNPVPGDHEGGKQFQGYLDYWDSSQRYYTATAGSWRLIALDSTERFGQTAPGTGQFEWLRAQLEADDDAGCTLVSFHEPRWAISSPEDYAYLDDLWALLVEEDVDLVINGHEHRYERWTPLDGAGMPDAGGPTEFVVGTGGHELSTSRRTDPRVDFAYTGDGALRLELGEGRADYEFIDTARNTLDSGAISCSGAPVDQPRGTTSPLVQTGTIANTGGVGARCRVGPDLDAEIITVVPEGTEVDLWGAPEGDWQPVRCNNRDGYISAQFVVPGG